MVTGIRSIKTKLLLLLCVVISACHTPPSHEQAVADYGKALGLVQTEVEIDGRQVQAWQFLLCDRVAMLHADNIPELLTDSEVCYNPFVDAKRGAAIFFSPPTTDSARTKAMARNVVKGVVVAGAVVLALFSIKFGIRTWKWFANMEDYTRYSQRLVREKLYKKDGIKLDGDKAKRFKSWFTDGGAVGILAGAFLIGDGGFNMLQQVFAINKTYFNHGKKVLFEWGLPAQTFINDYPYLVNDAWQDTKKAESIDTLLLGIKNTLKCEFSPRYLEENPLRSS